MTPIEERLLAALRMARREVAHRFDQGPCMGPRQGCAACTIEDALVGASPAWVRRLDKNAKELVR